MKRIVLFLVLFSLVGCVTLEAFFPPTQQETVAVTVKINDGAGVDTHAIKLTRMLTAYDAFDAVADLESKEYPPYGRMITSINGLEQSDDAGMYWQYYVDGELAPVGVDSFEIDRDMELEFRYEKPPELW